MSAENKYEKWLAVRRRNIQLIYSQSARDKMFRDTPLHQAVEANDAASVRRCLDSKTYDINALDSTGRTALHIATKNPDPAILELLLRCGAKTDKVDAFDQTPLHFAVKEGRTDAVTLLINFKANINKKDSASGYTPLHFAAEQGHENIAEILLNAGANTNATCKFLHSTPLELAAFNNNINVVEKLIARGPKLKKALFFAATNGYSDIVALLLKAGANQNSKHSGETILQCAARNGRAEVVELLLKAGANIYELNRGHNTLHDTAIGLVARTKYDDAAKRAGKDPARVIELLLAADTAHYGTDAFYYAVAKRDLEKTILILSNIQEPLRSNVDIFHSREEKAFIREALRILKQAEQQIARSEYVTSFLLAVRQGQDQAINPDLTSAISRSLGASEIFERHILHDIFDLCGAAENQEDKEEAATITRYAKAIANIRTRQELHKDFYRAIKHDLNIAARLLILNPNAANEPNHEGKTPLIRAIEEQNLAVLKKLLDRKADIHLPGRTGESALQIAGKNYPEAACLMIKSITTPQSFLKALKTLSSPLIAEEIYDSLHAKGRELGMFEKHKGWLTTGFKYPTVVDFFAAALEASTPEDIAPNPNATARETALAAVRSAQQRQLTRGTLWSSRVTESDEEAQEEEKEQQPLLSRSNQLTSSTRHSQHRR